MKQYKGYLFDIDGTILLGDTIIPGAKEKIEELRKRGKKIGFFTNNSSKNPKKYMEKFKEFGIESTLDEIITAGIVLLSHIEKNYSNKKVYIIGTEEYKNLYRAKGIHVVDDIQDFKDHNIDILIVALDTELNFKKLETACKLLKKDIKYFAANEDLVYPIENKIYLPDCKAICNMIELCTGKKPIYFGKPNGVMLGFALEKLNLIKEDIVIVGDRLYTDIACGNINDCDSILVLSGEATGKENSPYKPTYILESIDNL
ncbi:HAD-IIA family hydrolase [Candidatus Cetobacterium colombiensis]|uniref:HAD-IIA family hydrolase n=1 Tax=Candidatus Cetobacterium colombiensis TaxID=3073100 RepID=A0ABU4W7T2_9FUSO|nr:HAD-IIA family hydrolase [Candidatus Cetobacterium colombiensis]MDX8335595.1 HAD-IIA family hydrolase [Candidatus Cetobacterium colombiensis]